MKGNSYPLNLIRLDGDSLRGYLEGLYFLVIDQFNVSTLRSEDIRAIQDWVKDGGWLILGTGAYGVSGRVGGRRGELGRRKCR